MTKGDDDDCRSNFTKSEDGDESLTGLAPSIYGTLGLPTIASGGSSCEAFA